MDAVPHARIAPDFLASNAQAHHDILYAVADLLDNSREAAAQHCSINVRQYVSEAAANRKLQHTLLEIIDDGTGMTEHTMRRMLSIAYTEKDRTTGKHYGMGSTTSVPRLCKNAICLSVHASGHCTAGLLSTTLSKKAGFDELKVPQCSWNFDRRGGDRALPGSYCIRDGAKEGCGSALTMQARRESLQLMLQHSPFKTEAALLEEFDSLQEFGAPAGSLTGRPATGTRWIMWDVCGELQLRLPDADDVPDVIVRGRETEWAYRSSLRGFCEVLYYYDDEVAQRGPAALMELAIDGDPVEPRNWTTFLHHATTDMFKAPQALTGHSQAKVTFGYSLPLQTVIELFQDRTHSKNDIGTPFHHVSNYNGVFYYHKGTASPGGIDLPARLTRPLVKGKLQQSNAGGNQMATTFVRLTMQGKGIVGCCVENFLTQAHNKSEYVSQEGDKATFDTTHKRVSWFMQSYADKQVRPAVAKLMDRTASGARKPAMEDADDEEADRPVGDDPVGPSSQVGAGEASGSDFLGTTEADLALDIQFDMRMRAREGGVEGRVTFVGKGLQQKLLIKLKQADGTLSKQTFKPSQLEKLKYNPAQILAYPAGHEAFDGTQVKIWWDDDQAGMVGGRAGAWYDGTLRSKYMREGSNDDLGWFTVEYGDAADTDNVEDVFIALRPDRSFLARRDDGEELRPDLDIQLDDSALRRAFDSLSMAPPAAPKPTPPQSAAPSVSNPAAGGVPSAVGARLPAGHEPASSSSDLDWLDLPVGAARTGGAHDAGASNCDAILVRSSIMDSEASESLAIETTATALTAGNGLGDEGTHNELESDEVDDVEDEDEVEVDAMEESEGMKSVQANLATPTKADGRATSFPLESQQRFQRQGPSLMEHDAPPDETLWRTLQPRDARGEAFLARLRVLEADHRSSEQRAARETRQSAALQAELQAKNRHIAELADELDKMRMQQQQGTKVKSDSIKKLEKRVKDVKELHKTEVDKNKMLREQLEKAQTRVQHVERELRACGGSADDGKRPRLA